MQQSIPFSLCSPMMHVQTAVMLVLLRWIWDGFSWMVPLGVRWTILSRAPVYIAGPTHQVSLHDDHDAFKGFDGA